MGKVLFQWDEKKNRANIIKHGVAFDESQSAFKDEQAIQYFDPDPSENEDRFILLGMSTKLRMIVVGHCFRESDVVIRIISARKATKPERRNYQEVNQ